VKERARLLESVEDILLGREGAALVLRMSVNWVDKLLAKGLIPSSMHESRRIFSRDRLLAFLEAFENTTREERQAEGFRRRGKELEYAKVLRESANLYQRQVDLMKQSLGGRPVDNSEMNEIRDQLLETEAMGEQMLRTIDIDAGVAGFFRHVEPTKKGVRMEKVCIGYTEVGDAFGGMTRTPRFEMRPMDFSKQVQITNIQDGSSASKKR
jgi:hypothetical protein